jgi:hypothetical protein
MPHHPPNPHPRHLHARRHQQRRVLPPAGPARGRTIPGAARDALLLRVIGSPDPYGKQIDGMGGATSSTSKAVIVAKSDAAGPRRRLPVRPGLDRQALRRLERQLRQPVGGGRPVRDRQRPDRREPRAARTAWRSCASGRPTSARPSSPTCRWPAAQVQETGDFELDGVTFPAAEVQLEFMDPAAEEEGGGRRDVPDREPGRRARGAGRRHAEGDDDQRRHPDHLRQRRRDIGYTGTELQDAINGDPRRWRCSKPSAPTARCAWA